MNCKPETLPVTYAWGDKFLVALLNFTKFGVSLFVFRGGRFIAQGGFVEKSLATNGSTRKFLRTKEFLNVVLVHSNLARRNALM